MSVSPCCGASVLVGGAADTHWYECEKCGNAVDPVPEGGVGSVRGASNPNSPSGSEYPRVSDARLDAMIGVCKRSNPFPDDRYVPLDDLRDDLRDCRFRLAAAEAERDKALLAQQGAEYNEGLVIAENDQLRDQIAELKAERDALRAMCEKLAAALRALEVRHTEGWLVDHGGGGAEGWESDGLKVDVATATASLAEWDALNKGKPSPIPLTHHDGYTPDD
jgi:hypothetical protein